MININKVLRKYKTYIAILLMLCVSMIGRQGIHLYTGADVGLLIHFMNVNEFYNYRRNWPTSRLGEILFKGAKIPYPYLNKDRLYKILIWNDWDWIKNREPRYTIESIGEGTGIINGCSVTNCEFTRNKDLLDTVDAVVIFIQRSEVPKVENRNPNQRWIFLIEESPIYAWRSYYDQLHNVFNWSMTYRTDADVPVPSGRTIPLDEPIMADPSSADIATLVPYWDQKQTKVLASIVMSHCGVEGRDFFLKKVRQYITVDVYGGCSDNKEFKVRCPGQAYVDCNVTEQYLFYLALENSQCFQYTTEKVFYNSFTKGAVPIIWGPQYEDVRTLLPPNSFIYADEKTDVEALVKDIVDISKNYDTYLSLHRWRNHFKTVNEHGFFGTELKYFCRLCEAMNYNDERQKILKLNDLYWFMNKTVTCKLS